MNTKTFLVPILAVLAICLVGFASAGELVNGSVTTTFNDVVLSTSGMTMAGASGEVVPVRVTFNALNDAQDVKVRVWMEGFRDDVSSTTKRFNVVSGSTYSKLVSLQLPNDLDSTTKTFTLHVSLANADKYDSVDYIVKMQRDSYTLDILSVDYDTTVLAGQILPVAVVVDNTGFQDLENGYVTVSINDLGVSGRGFFGDLVAVEDNHADSHTSDSLQKTVYLTIPEFAKDGIYEMTVKAYNKDASSTVTRLIQIQGSTASVKVLAAMKNQDMNAGETKTYNLVIVNSGSDVGIFNINTVSGTGLDVSAPSVVTVGPKSSTTVPITVTASKNVAVGSYTFTVNVNDEQVVFGTNIVGGSSVSTSIVALTVVLVIIFVVLLVVLIVLLSRKDKPIEEVETSYY